MGCVAHVSLMCVEVALSSAGQGKFVRIKLPATNSRVIGV